MFTTLRFLIFTSTKKLFCILISLLFLPLFLFSTSAFSCSMAFQKITPEQLKDSRTISKTQHTSIQRAVFESFKQALNRKAQSFLHITPTSTGNPFVMAQALKEKLQNYRDSKISFVTTHKTRLADQLFDAIQAELKGMDVIVIKWNENLNTDFSMEIKRSVTRAQPTVFVITSQSLKSWLPLLQHESQKDYTRLVKNTDGIYINEAYYLSVFNTRSDLSLLQEKSGALLYVTTATSAYKEFTNILIKKGITSLSEWKEQRKINPELKHFPENSYIFYTEWNKNGSREYIHNIQEGKSKPTYKELIELLVRKNIMSPSEWEKQRETDPELKYIPKKIYLAYKEWGPNGSWRYVRKQANN